MFHVGQKVICVDDALLAPKWGVRKGNIYTVIRSERYFGSWMVDLAEAHVGDPAFPSYFSFRFRLLIERKTDISIFKRMLVPNRARETV